MPRRSFVAPLAALTLACGAPPPAPAPRPALPGERECLACHTAVADAWSRSRHHHAFTNPDFQRAYAREPLPFCRDCHAPEHADLAPADAESRGVGCLTCHRDGDTLVTRGDPGTPSSAPHPVRRDPAFGTTACARCHEFEFPAHADAGAGAMMQTTHREHRASPFAARACADCHMPAGAHDLASTRDPAAMRRALDVTARRDGATLVLDLRPRDVGHAFPTGDLFRRLAVHAALREPDGRARAHQVRYLARHFVPRHHPDGRLNLAGTRPPVDDRLVGPTTLRLDLPQADPPAELAWWVDLERVDHRDMHHPERSTIAGTIRLAEGRLPP